MNPGTPIQSWASNIAPPPYNNLKKQGFDSCRPVVIRKSVSVEPLNAFCALERNTHTTLPSSAAGNLTDLQHTAHDAAHEGASRGDHRGHESRARPAEDVVVCNIDDIERHLHDPLSDKQRDLDAAARTCTSM
eukprot:5185957-Amphidinium_carterae.1